MSLFQIAYNWLVLIHFASFYLLSEYFYPFMFKVITDKIEQIQMLVFR